MTSRRFTANIFDRVTRFGVSRALWILLLASSPTPILAARGEADRVVAVAQRRVYTQRDLDLWVFESRLLNPDREGEADEALRRKYLTQAVNDAMLAAWAELQVTPPREEAVALRYQSAMERYADLAGGAVALVALMGEAGIDPTEFRDWVKTQARNNILVRDGVGVYADLGGATPFDGKVSEASEVRIAHILVLPAGSDEAAITDARERALRVRRDIAAGLDFTEAARLHSDDRQTQKSGGALGWFRREQVKPAIWDSVSELKMGETSAPIVLEDGVHLFQVIDFETPGMQEYAVKFREEERRRLVKLREDTDIILADGYALEPIEVSVDADRFWLGVENESRQAEEFSIEAP